MRTKYIAYLILVFGVVISVSSCNDDDTVTYEEGNPSKNALITSFSLTGTPINATDSVTYPVLEKTKFAIDHIKGIIYNPDSLAYGTRLAKFKPAISLPETSITVDVQYADTVVTLNSENNDSIDFSKSVTLRIIPAAGASYRKDYVVKINIHQYDPDTLNWMRVASLPVAANVSVKAIALENNLVAYALVGNKVNAYITSLQNVSWSTASVTALPANTRLSSITHFEGKLFAIAADGSSYKASATDPANWTAANNGMNVHNLLGILPSAVKADDKVLVAVNDNGKYKLGTTTDMDVVTLVDSISSFAEPILPVEEKFPSFDFSSTTNYNRSKLSENTLVLAGGVDFEGGMLADIWLIKLNKKNIIEIAPLYNGINGKKFDVNADFKAFIYDEKLYAATSDTLYTSTWGMNWAVAPQKQQFLSTIETAKNQSIVIDRNNYIWIVGSKDQAGRVWRGRLNRLAQ